jgi:hypothetical protein
VKRSIILLAVCFVFGLAALWYAKPLLVRRVQQATAPGLGDLMMATLQPRHTKLGLAGQKKNWPYAAYELGELQESFDRIERLSPRWHDFAVSETIQAVTREPMANLSTAIKGADAAAFAQAYGQLTEGCNLCHQSAGRGVIVIQAPGISSLPDQDFRRP